MTKARSCQSFVFVPLTYEQHLEIFERELASLVAAVSSFASERDLTGEHRETFNGLFNIAHAHLFWSKEKIVETFRPLESAHIRCLD